MGQGVKDNFFWSEIGSGFEEPGSTPPQEFPGVPPSQLVELVPFCIPSTDKWYTFVSQYLTVRALHPLLTTVNSPLKQEVSLSLSHR